MTCMRYITRKWRTKISTIIFAAITFIAFQVFISRIPDNRTFDSFLKGTTRHSEKYFKGDTQNRVDISPSEVEQREGNFARDKTSTDPADVMILTYIRSGSTFIGRILGHRHDTHYWYEPLWTSHRLEYIAENGEICMYGKLSCRNVSESDRKSWIHAREYLLSLYTCENLEKFKHRFTAGIQGNTFLAGPTGTNLRNCWRKKNYSCYPEIIKNCTTAKHRASKVLRMETAHAQYLLENLPRLKIIQLLRDPRAVISSRIKENWFYNKRVTPHTDAPTLCTRMDNDLKAALYLQKLYPDRVKIIQYEDFHDPVRTASKLYSFLNMEMTQFEAALLNSINSSDTNYGFHPDAYRKRLSWDVNETVNKHCRSILHKLGLRVFENIQEFRDMNINVRVSSGALPYGL